MHFIQTHFTSLSIGQNTREDHPSIYHKKKHSTYHNTTQLNTLNTALHNISNTGFSQKQPPARKIIVAFDMSKALTL